MVTAEYTLTGKYGELRRVSGSGKTIRFVLGKNLKGTLCFGSKSSELSAGECRLTTEGLVHGLYSPYLLHGGATVELEPLLVVGESVSSAATAEKIHRYALERIGALEEKTKILEERINELQTAIRGTALFE